MHNVITATATDNANDNDNVVTFDALQGKFHKINAVDRVQRREAQGLSALSQFALNIDARVSKNTFLEQEINAIALQLAGGNIRPAYLAVISKAKINETILIQGGKAPYSEWLRLMALLKAKPQTTKSGKPSTARAALNLANDIQARSDAIRAARIAKIE